MMNDATKAEPVEGAPVALRRSRSSKGDKWFDVALGARIRAFRIAAGLSQAALGQAIGLTFQQVQKYEVGKDRVAAGTLKAIADALDVHPGTLFDDAPVPTGSGSEQKAAVTAGAVLQQIRDPHVLKRLLDLAKVLSEGAGDGPGVRLRRSPASPPAEPSA